MTSISQTMRDRVLEGQYLMADNGRKMERA